MASVCFLCKKNVGLLDKLGSKKYNSDVICGSCVKQINDVLGLYFQKVDGYTLDQLEVVNRKVPDLLVHCGKIKEINSKYDEKEVAIKNKLRESEKELSEAQQSSARESQRRKLEYKKEIDKINREAGRDASGKKIIWDAEERRMIKELNYYKKKGMSLEANNIEMFFAQQDEFYQQDIQDVNNLFEKDERSFSLLLEAVKKQAEYVKTMLLLLNGMRLCEKFSYIFTSVLPEEELFGFVGKKETQSKDLANAVKVIKATITDVLGDKIKEYNLDKLSYQQLAQLYYDYLNTMGDADVEITRAKGMLESHTFAMEASGVYGGKLYDRDCKDNQIIADNYKKRQTDYNNRLIQLQKKYILFLQTGCESSSSLEEKKNISLPMKGQSFVPEAPKVTESISENRGAVEEPILSKICSSCGKANKETSRFCSYCGSALESPRFCTQCGTKLRPGKKFCSRCGEKVE